MTTLSDVFFRILSIDGGGMRGVFPAHILKCVSERLEVRARDHFQLIAGTSTGAIIAAAVACGIEPGEIVSMYLKHGQEIFRPMGRPLPRIIRSALSSLYDSTRLKGILKSIFGETKMGDVQVPLLLPATDVGLGGVHVFKSSYSPDFTRDRDVPVYEAVVASCSAPMYFDPVRVKEYLLADGGLWANNPSLAAVIDAQHRLNAHLEYIRVLSLGTGYARESYGLGSNRRWGILRAWKGTELVAFIMSVQARSIHNYLKLMLGDQQLLRLDFDSDLPLPMDDCSSVDDLISRADKEFSYRSADLKRFLQLGREVA